MKDNSTLVKYTREELEHVPDETDWEKVYAMTDEEVYQDALSDKDAQPTDETFWETAPLPFMLPDYCLFSNLFGMSGRSI